MSIISIQAQNNSDTSKLKFFDKVVHWLSAYELSAPDFMEEEKLQFKNSCYSFVYIEALITTDVWIFSQLNKVTTARIAEKNQPYFNFKLQFIPNEEFTSYTLTANLSSSEAKEVSLSKYEKDLNDTFSSKTYSDPLEAMEDITESIGRILALISEELGNSLAPDLYFRIHDTPLTYFDHETIEVYPDEQQTVELEVLNARNEVIPGGEVKWKNASPVENRAVVDLRDYPSKKVSAESEGEVITADVRLINDIEDIRELVRSILVETLTATKQQSLDSIKLFKQDSSDARISFQKQQEVFESMNVQVTENKRMQSLGVYSLYSQPIRYTEQEKEKFYQHPELKKGAESAQKLLVSQRKKQRHLNTIALIDKILYQPQSLDEFLDDLLSQSGQLLARLLLGKNREGKKEDARGIVIQYINQRIIFSANEG